MGDLFKIAFLFGAGAEGKGNFNMPNGMEYLLKSVMYSSKQDESVKKPSYRELDALKAFFNDSDDKNQVSEKYFENTYKYRKDRISRETIEKSIFFHLVCPNAMKDKKLFSQIYDNIEDEFRAILQKMACGKTQTYSQIKSKVLKEILDYTEDKKDEKIQFVVSASLLSGKLDAYFHTLIDPKKYGEINFSKVFNYYWKCYFTIVEALLRYLKSLNSDSLKWVDAYFQDDELQYEKVLRELAAFTRKLYETEIPEESCQTTYYHLIREKVKETNHRVPNSVELKGAITTNYFNLCEKVMGLCSERVAYINGQLKHFEFPEILEVRDAIRFESDLSGFGNEHLFFPFIFGQSFVKPIVHPIQIKEFRKMDLILRQLNCLVVLGYGMNEDDNHLNAYLHDYLTKGGYVIVVQGNENDAAERALRYKGNNLRKCIVDYKENQHVVEEIFKTIAELFKES